MLIRHRSRQLFDWGSGWHRPIYRKTQVILKYFPLEMHSGELQFNPRMYTQTYTPTVHNGGVAEWNLSPEISLC